MLKFSQGTGKTVNHAGYVSIKSGDSYDINIPVLTNLFLNCNHILAAIFSASGKGGPNLLRRSSTKGQENGPI